RRIRWLVTGGVAAVAAGAIGFLFWPRPVEVDVASVRTGTLVETVSDQGVARVRESYVVSAPVKGQLERLPLEIGDRVVANKTVVARIRPTLPEFLDPRTRAQAQSAVDAARSAVDSAIAQRNRLRAEATRTRDLWRRVSTLAEQG